MNKRNKMSARFGLRLFSQLMTLAMILTLLPMSAMAAEEDGSAKLSQNTSAYVLMNIPYADFYAAETDDGETLDDVDAIASATKNKPSMSNLAGGSYHVNSDSSDITGTIYPVYVEDIALLEDCKRVEKEADLFCNDSYAYCELNEAPASYKVMTKENDTFKFGSATGTKTAVTGVTATLSTDDHHVPYVISLSGLNIPSSANVSGVVIRTTDNNVIHGMRHLFEIWQKTKLGFYVDANSSFGANNDDHSELVGKTIKNVTYYLSDGQILVTNDINLKVPPLANVEATVTSVDAGATSTSFELKGSLPRDFVPEYSVNLQGATVNADSNTISLPADAAFGTYKLTIADKNGVYAPVTASFSLYGYVLMNIPYSEFYASEKKGSDKVASVDAISSATKSKTRSTLATGSYHVNSNGTDITGVIYPVQVGDASVLNGFKQITDNDSITIEVSLRGNVVTTTYKGKDSLFEQPSYSYYVLSEKPDSYKTLNVRRGTKSFGAATASAEVLTGASATISTNDRHVDVAIKVTDEGGTIKSDNISGVTLHTTDNNVYGLRHVYEIWRGTELGFNLTGDNGDYASLQNKTIDKITYYLNNGKIYTIDVNLYVPYGGVLSDISGAEGGTTYKSLFNCILQEEYEQYWHDYCAAVLGADNAALNNVVTSLRTSCAGDLYGSEAVEAYGNKPEATQFCCDFINGAETISVNGNVITIKKTDGSKESHQYSYQGKFTVGEAPMAFTGDLYMTNDNAGEFKYFLFRDDSPDTTYHIEFRYGSNLEQLKGYITGDYAYWLAAGIPVDADETMIKNCIALFCLENMDYSGDRSAESKTQIRDLVGTWDYYVNGAAQHDTLYFTIDNNGLGTSYYLGEQSSTYQAFAFDNNRNGKSGVYTVYNEKGEVNWSDYEITVSGRNTFLTFNGYEGNVPYTLTYVKQTSSSGNSSNSGSTVDPGNSEDPGNSGSNTEPTEPANHFIDVPDGAYYEDAVNWAVNKGITSGTTKTTFSPGESCTRAQMVTFLWRAAGSPKVSGSSQFSDISSDEYYYDAVLWALEKGITSGTSATTFSPDSVVTRGQTVTFLYRAAGSPASSGASFSDVSSDAYYANAVAWASNNHITSGTGNDQFSPDADCTRAQIVTFLYRNAAI